MNRKKIINILLSTIKYTDEQKDIIMQLEEAKLEWESSKEYFQVVNDPKLVDYAIYKEDQSKSRYIYFLLEARRMDVTIDASFMIEELDAIGK